MFEFQRRSNNDLMRVYFSTGMHNAGKFVPFVLLMPIHLVLNHIELSKIKCVQEEFQCKKTKLSEDREAISK
jgi:hypothetical protein